MDVNTQDNAHQPELRRSLLRPFPQPELGSRRHAAPHSGCDRLHVCMPESLFVWACVRVSQCLRAAGGVLAQVPGLDLLCYSDRSRVLSIRIIRSVPCNSSSSLSRAVSGMSAVCTTVFRIVGPLLAGALWSHFQKKAILARGGVPDSLSLWTGPNSFSMG